MEELSALAVLYIQKIISEEKYLAKIEEYFNENPNDKILLELVWMDANESSLYLVKHILPNFENYDLFGKFLMEYLENYYRNDCKSIDEFYNHTWNMYFNFPNTISSKEPFEMFDWIDSPEFDGYKTCMEIYEKAFNYYKN